MSDGGVDGSESDPMLSREERVELFGEQKVEHIEWSTEQRRMVRSVIDDALDFISDRNGVMISQHGTTVKRNGKHEARIKLYVAGDPWDPDSVDSDDAEVRTDGGHSGGGRGRKRYRIVLYVAPGDLGDIETEFQSFWTFGVQADSAEILVHADDGFAEKFEGEAELNVPFHVEEVSNHEEW